MRNPGDIDRRKRQRRIDDQVVRMELYQKSSADGLALVEAVLAIGELEPNEEITPGAWMDLLKLAHKVKEG